MSGPFGKQATKKGENWEKSGSEWFFFSCSLKLPGHTADYLYKKSDPGESGTGLGVLTGFLAA